MIPEAAVEASSELVDAFTGAFYDSYVGFKDRDGLVRDILEAAAPHMLADVELMQWKLDALSEWATAMVEESNSPQYGRDVRSLLGVGSMDEAREIDAL